MQWSKIKLAVLRLQLREGVAVDALQVLALRDARLHAGVQVLDEGARRGEALLHIAGSVSAAPRPGTSAVGFKRRDAVERLRPVLK